MKLKNTSKKLSKWSRSSVGNIFNIIKALEERVVELDDKSINENSETNRAALNLANAELIRALKKEESF